MREPIVLGYLNARKSGTQSTRKKIDEEFTDILELENAALEISTPGILRNRERKVGIHLVSFYELKSYIATNL